MTGVDEEANRFSARAMRYARVGAGMGSVAARMAGTALFGGDQFDATHALALTRALGGLKGPLMKVAQFATTIPDLLPPDFAKELQTLQSQAPPMGAAFVKRRMRAELGAQWAERFASFDLHASAAASLGQVHRAYGVGGEALACKLQYPDMDSVVEADLTQLKWLFALHRQIDGALDSSAIVDEIAARVREELDYQREAQHARLYHAILGGHDHVRVPRIWNDLSTRRLLTLSWLEGAPVLSFKDASLDVRNAIARAMFDAWWFPFSHYGVIHGDPHLGNYTVYGEGEALNLLDYGCIRLFPVSFVGGVVDLYRGLQHQDEARIVHAYETWGFKGLSRDLIDVLNIWARFIYGPLLDDRVRSVADGVAPADYGRAEAMKVRQELKAKGPVRIPREFVFMDRAAIGLGAVFLHLRCELNFYTLFNATIESFDHVKMAARQDEALQKVGLRVENSAV
jgi:predicted unusual protein kinase regulating ubiquinone biosynthesis (AarF/ABC1/UbiB family)